MSQKTKEKDCHHCSESFEPKRKNQRYCSASCRVMACYKRKGYTYVSGHYQKAKQIALAPVAEPYSSAPMPTCPTLSQVPVQTELQAAAPPESKGMTGSGVMEAVVGSGVVALGEYFAFYQPMLKQMKEMRQMLDVLGHKLNAMQQGCQISPSMGFPSNQPLKQQPLSMKGGMQAAQANQPHKAPSLTPHQEVIKRLGLDPNKYGK